MSAGQRLGAWIVTGPVGRLAAFLADVTAYLWQRLRDRRRGGDRGAR
jgi:hypothetical protein